MLPKLKDYTRNVVKSVTYIATQSLTEGNPALTEFAEQNKELGKTLYIKMADYKKTLREAKRYIVEHPLFEASQDLIKNSLADIQSGKFYNPERDTAATDTMAKSMNFDLSDNMDEFLGEGFSQGDKAIAKSINSSSKAGAKAISSTIVGTTQALLKQGQGQTMFQFEQNKRMMSFLGSGMSSISNELRNSNQFFTKDMRSYITASTKYYSDHMKAVNEQMAMMKEMLEIQKNVYNDKATKKESKHRTDFFDLISANGMPNLKEYGQVIEKNLAEVLSENTGGMLGKDKETLRAQLKTFTASPLSFIASFMVQSAMAPKLKRSLKMFNDTLSGAFATAIAKQLNAKDDYGNKFGQILGKIFGVKIQSKGDIDTAKYNKGAVPFDGIVRKAIVEVIPYHLRNIESALTGRDPKAFNFQTGKWVNVAEYLGEVANQDKRMRLSANSELVSYLHRTFGKKGIVFKDATDQKNVHKAIDSFGKSLWSHTGYVDFNLSDADFNNAYNIGNIQYAKLIKSLLKNLRGTSGQAYLMRAAQENIQARRNQANRMKQAEEDPDNIMRMLLASEGYNTKEMINTETGITKFNKDTNKFSPMFVKDTYGISAIQYLRDILTEISSVRKNGLLTYVANRIAVAHGGNNNNRNNRRNNNGGLSEEDKARITSRLSETEVLPQGYDEVKVKYNTKKQIEKARRNQDERFRHDVESIISGNQNGETTIIDNADDLSAANQKIMELHAQGVIDYENSKGNANWAQKFLSEDEKDFEQKHRDVLHTMEEKGFLDALLKADTIGDKYAVLRKGLMNLTEKPSMMLTKALEKSDKYIYDFFFGSKEQELDVNGKPINGFFDKMTNEMKKTFMNVNKWFNDEFAKPFRKWLKLKDGETILGRLGDITGVTQLSKALKDVVLKPFGKGVQSGMKTLWHDTTKSVSSVIDDISSRDTSHKEDEDEDIQHHASGARLITKSGLTTISKGELIIPSTKNPFNPDRKNASIIRDAANERRIKDTYMHMMRGDMKVGMHAAGTPNGGITETELASLFANDTVLPKIEERYSHKRNGNVRKILTDMLLLNLKNESNRKMIIEPMATAAGCSPKKLARRFNALAMKAVKALAKSDNEIKHIFAMKYSEYMQMSASERYGIYSTFMTRVGETLLNMIKADPKLKNSLVDKAKKTANNVGSKIKGVLHDAGKKAGDKLGSYIPDRDSEADKDKFNEDGSTKWRYTLLGQMAEEGKSMLRTIFYGKDDKEAQMKWNKSISKIQSQIDDKLPKAGFGAGVGAILGVTTGLVGPLSGAVIGAAYNIMSHSESVLDFLLGKEMIEHDENGNEVKVRRGGFIPPSFRKFYAKYGADMKRFGLAGGAAGLILPGIGPLGAAILGASASIVKNNERLHNFVFGNDFDDDSGILSRNRRAKIRKAFPNMAVGALATMMFDPTGGILTNAALGTGIGLLSSSERFKRVLFGKKKHGKRRGGLVGLMKKGVIDPFITTGKVLGKFTKHILMDQIIHPLRNVMNPLTKQFEIMGRTISHMMKTFVKKFISSTGKWLHETIGSMLGSIKYTISRSFTSLLQRFGLQEKWHKAKKNLWKGTKKLWNAATFAINPLRWMEVPAKALTRHQMLSGNADYLSVNERLKMYEENPDFYQKNADNAYVKLDRFMGDAGTKAQDIREMYEAVKSHNENTERFQKGYDTTNRAVFKHLKENFGNTYIRGNKHSVAVQLNSYIKKQVDAGEEIDPRYIADLIGRSNSTMTSTEKDEFMQELEKKVNKFKTYKKAKDQYSEYDQELLSGLSKLGFDIKNPVMAKKVEKMLKQGIYYQYNREGAQGKVDNAEELKEELSSPRIQAFGEEFKLAVDPLVKQQVEGNAYLASIAAMIKNMSPDAQFGSRRVFSDQARKNVGNFLTEIGIDGKDNAKLEEYLKGLSSEAKDILTSDTSEGQERLRVIRESGVKGIDHVKTINKFLTQDAYKTKNELKMLKTLKQDGGQFGFKIYTGLTEKQQNELLDDSKMRKLFLELAKKDQWIFRDKARRLPAAPEEQFKFIKALVKNPQAKMFYLTGNYDLNGHNYTATRADDMMTILTSSLQAFGFKNYEESGEPVPPPEHATGTKTPATKDTKAIVSAGELKINAKDVDKIAQSLESTDIKLSDGINKDKNADLFDESSASGATMTKSTDGSETMVMNHDNAVKLQRQKAIEARNNKMATDMDITAKATLAMVDLMNPKDTKKKKKDSWLDKILDKVVPIALAATGIYELLQRFFGKSKDKDKKKDKHSDYHNAEQENGEAHALVYAGKRFAKYVGVKLARNGYTGIKDFAKVKMHNILHPHSKINPFERDIKVLEEHKQKLLAQIKAEGVTEDIEKRLAEVQSKLKHANECIQYAESAGDTKFANEAKIYKSKAEEELKAIKNEILKNGKIVHPELAEELEKTEAGMAKIAEKMGQPGFLSVLTKKAGRVGTHIIESLPGGKIVTGTARVSKGVANFAFKHGFGFIKDSLHDEFAAAKRLAPLGQKAATKAYEMGERLGVKAADITKGMANDVSDMVEYAGSKFKDTSAKIAEKVNGSKAGKVLDAATKSSIYVKLKAKLGEVIKKVIAIIPNSWAAGGKKAKLLEAITKVGRAIMERLMSPKVMSKLAALFGVATAVAGPIGDAVVAVTGVAGTAAYETSVAVREPGRILGIKADQCGPDEYILAEICGLFSALSYGIIPDTWIAKVCIDWIGAVVGVGGKLRKERADLAAEAKKAGMSVEDYQKEKLGMELTEEKVADWFGKEWKMAKTFIGKAYKAVCDTIDEDLAAGKQFLSDSGTFIVAALKDTAAGNMSGLMSEGMSLNGQGPVLTALGYAETGIVRYLLLPNTCMNAAINAISNGFSEMVDSLEKSAPSAEEVNAITTHSGIGVDYWSLGIISNENGDTGTTLHNLMTFLYKILYAVPAGIRGVFDTATNMYDTIKNFIGDHIDSWFHKAKKDKPADSDGGDGGGSSSDGGSWISNGWQGLKNGAASLYHGVTGSGSSRANKYGAGSKDKNEIGLGDLFDTMRSYRKRMEDEDNSRYGKGLPGSVPFVNTTALSDKNFYSQLNPSISNIAFNAKGDTVPQTIGDSACGPMSAANAISSATGKTVDPLDITRTALKYKEKNGGTKFGFFKEGLQKYGVQGKAISTTDVASNLAQGNPVIMMGKDSTTHTMGTGTPYGRNPHYITATGIDRNGNAIVQDPESRIPNRRFPLRQLTSKTTHAFTVKPSRFGKGNAIYRPLRHQRRLAKYGMGGATDVPEYIWNFLKGKGLGSIQIAAIMGNIAVESGGYDLNAKSQDGAGSYGLCQWTDSRKTRLFNYCSQNGYDASSVEGQMNYFWYEATNFYKKALSDLMAQNNIEDATRVWCVEFEGPSVPLLDRRIANAKEAFQKQGKGIKFVGSYSGGSASSGAAQQPPSLIDLALAPIVQPLTQMNSTLNTALGSVFTNVIQSSGMAGIAAQFGINMLGAPSGGSSSGGTAGGPLQNIGTNKAQAGSAQAYEVANMPGAEVTSPYGVERSYETHGGVDIGIPVGTSIPSPVSGKIVDVGCQPGGYGNYIQVEDANGNYHLFAHLSQTLAARGQQVKKGDIIAKSGGAAGAPGSGNSTGPHTHYEVDPPSNFSALSKGAHLNPATYSVAGLGTHNYKYGTGNNANNYFDEDIYDSMVEAESDRAVTQTSSRKRLNEAAKRLNQSSKEMTSKYGTGSGYGKGSGTDLTEVIALLKEIATNTANLKTVVSVSGNARQKEAAANLANSTKAKLAKVASTMNAISSNSGIGSHAKFLADAADIVSLMSDLAKG